MSLRTAEEVATSTSSGHSLVVKGSVATMMPKKSILVRPTTKKMPKETAKMTDKTQVRIIPDTADYWQLNLCTTSRALISFSLVEMSTSKAEKKAWLMRQPAKGLPWLTMKSNDEEIQHMKTGLKHCYKNSQKSRKTLC